MPTALRSALSVALLLQTMAGWAAEDAQPVREHLNIDADWRFHRDDPADVPAGSCSYAQTKTLLLSTSNDLSHAPPVPCPGTLPGQGLPVTQLGYDDATWRQVSLPHDWAIEGPFDIHSPGETGKLPSWGVGWYRKRIHLDEQDAGRRIALDIDGAMSYSLVWINGRLVGGWPYGYTSYELDLTPYLAVPGDNVIAIRLDNPPDSSRWYPGAGLYRNVWLTTTASLHIAYWGTTITTPTVSAAAATVQIATAVANQGSAPAGADVAVAIYAIDADDRRLGPPVAIALAHLEPLAPGSVASARSACTLPAPRLWSPSSPARYLAVTELQRGHLVIDRTQTIFGVRSIAFDVRRGFLLNGVHLAIDGVCGHHDLGALGAAFNVSAARRQLAILKDMGVNALRTSHNMPAPELLDLCDRMGILVMDESFDCWLRPKKPNDYHLLFADWHERDLRAEYRRDRNHPSVIMWSLGNEIPEQGTAAALPIVQELVRIAHEEDPTRPATMGANNGARPGFAVAFATALDIFGENYRPFEYQAFRAKCPALPQFGSETASTVSSRGEYFFPVDRSDGYRHFQVTSYDVAYPGWATTPDSEFAALDANPDVAGEFIWTGFDYLGEPTPFNKDLTNLLNFRDDPVLRAAMAKELQAMGRILTPSRSSYFGAIDLAGFRKDRFYLYQSRWRPDLPMAHILPHWNWPDRIGQVTPVQVYTSGDEAELFLDGRSLGRQRRRPGTYRFIWPDVVYHPGVLTVRCYRGGSPWAEDTVATTGPGTAIRLTSDAAALHGDGVDLGFATAAIVDAAGRVVPTAHDRIAFSVLSGPGILVATDNGDATDLEIFSQPTRRAFHGLALAILRTAPGSQGDIQLQARADGLVPAVITLHAGP